jgi:RNA ligase (TIGR02306 family)
MTVTYERFIDHCKPSPYIKNCTIKTVLPAENADALDIVTFNELGWQSVIQKGSLKVGDEVIFLVPETVIPNEMAEELNITKYLSKGKVHVATLRGNRSAGLIVSKEVLEKYRDYILRWEDPPEVALRGEAMAKYDVNIDFEEFYRMPHLMNEPDTFRVGEKLFYSEKIHGANFRFGKLRHPVTGDYVIYVGGHEIVLKENEKNTYWRMFNKYFRTNLPEDLEFFAEIAGCGIQKGFHYGSKKDSFAKVFAISKNVQYLPVPEVIRICDELGFPHVDFHEIVYDGIASIQALADEDSEITNEHIREGVVLVSAEDANRMAKCLSFYYLEGKDKRGKKIKTTEFH